MHINWYAALLAGFGGLAAAAIIVGIPTWVDWWVRVIGTPSERRQRRLMKRALRKHSVDTRKLGGPCLMELTSHVSGLAAFTQQQHASSAEWAFNQMADPSASFVAGYVRGTIRKDVQGGVYDILRRHRVEPGSQQQASC
jgi:hypothetical protein